MRISGQIANRRILDNMVHIRQSLIFQITIGRFIAVVYECPGAVGGGDVVVGQAVDGEVVDGGGLFCELGFYYGGAVGDAGARIVSGAAGGVGRGAPARVVPGAVARRRSPGVRSWALVQPVPWTQKRWVGVGVVVTVPPSSVVTLQVAASSCTGATRTSRASSAPVWGLWARTRSPTFLHPGDGPGVPIGHDHRRVGGETRLYQRMRRDGPGSAFMKGPHLWRPADRL